MTARFVAHMNPARSQNSGRAYFSGFDATGGRWWLLSPVAPGGAWALKYDAPAGRSPDLISLDDPPLLPARSAPPAMIEASRDDG